MELKRVAFQRRMKHALNRPFRFLYKDTMLSLVVAYTGLNYIITYQMFSAEVSIPYGGVLKKVILSEK